MNRKRCGWCEGDALYIRYHDREWGVPVQRDNKWFEFLVLEGVQAGLSWLTVLKKREHYRQALDGFDFNKVAAYDGRKRQALLQELGLVRNRLKMQTIVNNAQAYLRVREEFGSFNRYIWRFTDGRSVHNQWRRLSDVPANTDLSDTLSRNLKQRGFRFVGTTICYAFMQATGLVNDHLVDCFRHRELNRHE